MEEVRYMISDAANLLHVESHVLRYWEEELELEIPRNEMGHRYYTEENIIQFEKIRKLKEEGYQLKAIKMLVHNTNPQIPDELKTTEVVSKAQTETACVQTKTDPGMSKLDQFQLLMTRIVRDAIAENNHELGREVSTQVGDKVIKEMNYLMREREEQEEERFRKLDEAIRIRQKRMRRQKKEKKVKCRRGDKPGKLRLEPQESTLS
ncbi:zinc-responsive transcriptional regulator [uncultured Roseburia sp.]|uniref:Helix-turn-helix domain-containing protein n=1 Tax=Brotonthovivens ammoniilytica TaxID=2981725 RepID=A0ABT2TI99_9FIRM|nr:MerR family transcriptional regulator [Brotonthovivens ammoniilytica]MCU6761832.1 helix-turn-helix domain-containing protein [Brotonthovivens ammoniilytica]SCI47984.1 zinc-responsive transcriptional regulator [uncultured Roseburia sp.]